MTALRVTADRERCAGTGSCVLTEPAVFDQDTGDGRVIVLDAEPAEGLRSSVTEAVSLCPTAAIRLNSVR